MFITFRLSFKKAKFSCVRSFLKSSCFLHFFLSLCVLICMKNCVPFRVCRFSCVLIWLFQLSTPNETSIHTNKTNNSIFFLSLASLHCSFTQMNTKWKCYIIIYCVFLSPLLCRPKIIIVKMHAIILVLVVVFYSSIIWCMNLMKSVAHFPLDVCRSDRFFPSFYSFRCFVLIYLILLGHAVAIAGQSINTQYGHHFQTLILLSFVFKNSEKNRPSWFDTFAVIWWPLTMLSTKIFISLCRLHRHAFTRIGFDMLLNFSFIFFTSMRHLFPDLFYCCQSSYIRKKHRLAQKLASHSINKNTQTFNFNFQKPTCCVYMMQITKKSQK